MPKLFPSRLVHRVRSGVGDYAMEGTSGHRKVSTPQASLEDQLRAMILGNVTIDDSNQHRSKNAPQRGHGPRLQHGSGHQNEATPSNTRGQQQHSAVHHSRLPFSSRNRLDPSPADSGPSLEASSDQSFGLGRDRGRGGRNRYGHPWSSGREKRADYNGTHPQSQPQHPRQGFRGMNHQGPSPPPFEMFAAQCKHLDQLASTHVAESQMSPDEMAAKDAFRDRLQSICRTALSDYEPEQRLQLQLKSFGSFSSGFATKGSDMDLSMALTTTESPPRAVEIRPPLLRVFERALLSQGLGARLLTRTRVPILKICELPTSELHTALLEERKRWEDLPEEEQYATGPFASNKQTPMKIAEENSAPRSDAHPTDPRKSRSEESSHISSGQDTAAAPPPAAKPPHKVEKHWLREKRQGPLDFSKHGLGIQSDVNFSNDLALHNTHLLRCYCLCDQRVQPMVLFVKAWAKQRKINSSYSGTLSSYGYVLMVLHFLANVADPPVIPNLQLSWRPPPQGSWGATLARPHYVNGYDVRYWDDEAAIKTAAQNGNITTNSEPLGALLRNFFQYYASTAMCFGIGRGFQWTQDVLSLRTRGGTVRKHAKGWTGAKTTTVGTQEVRHRYLFAIEDPFETDHNVARTVTHFGVVAIRDEFRRAWRIISGIEGGQTETIEDIFAAVEEVQNSEETDRAAAVNQETET